MPIFAVHDGCSAVSASAATHATISSSVSTSGPGDNSPAENGATPPADDAEKEQLRKRLAELDEQVGLLKADLDEKNDRINRLTQRLVSVEGL